MGFCWTNTGKVKYGFSVIFFMGHTYTYYNCTELSNWTDRCLKTSVTWPWHMLDFFHCLMPLLWLQRCFSNRFILLHNRSSTADNEALHYSDNIWYNWGMRYHFILLMTFTRNNNYYKLTHKFSIAVGTIGDL